MLTQSILVLDHSIVIARAVEMLKGMKQQLLKIARGFIDFMMPKASDLSLEQWQRLECRRSYAYPCKLSEYVNDLRR